MVDAVVAGATLCPSSPPFGLRKSLISRTAATARGVLMRSRMPSQLHEVLLLLFRNRPDLAPELASTPTGLSFTLIWYSPP